MKTAEELAERGAKRAAEHADRVNEGWSDEAYNWITSARYIGDFTVEMVRKVAESCGLPKPPDARAWGAVVKRAHREGIIEPCGYAKAGKSGHAGPRTLWRRKQ